MKTLALQNCLTTACNVANGLKIVNAKVDKEVHRIDEKLLILCHLILIRSNNDKIIFSDMFNHSLPITNFPMRLLKCRLKHKTFTSSPT